MLYDIGKMLRDDIDKNLDMFIGLFGCKYGDIRDELQDIEIEFSNKRKHYFTSRQIEYSRERANEIIKKIIEELESLREYGTKNLEDLEESIDILKDIEGLDNEECHWDSDACKIVGNLKEYCRRNEYSDNYGEELSLNRSARELLKKAISAKESIKYDHWVLGEYCRNGFPGKKDKIVIYLNTIDALYLHPIFRKELVLDAPHACDVVKTVFAHELFHAFHYRAISKESKRIWNHNSKKTKIVIESLASYVEYLYCEMNRNINYQNDLEKGWRRNNESTWPYSGAKYIKDLEDKFNVHGHKALEDVFTRSTYDFDEAYNLLMAYKEITE